MSLSKTILLSLLITLTIWVFHTWPLAMHIDTGIPSSSTNIEKYQMRSMIPGDQLQLLYNYWLFSDMLAGNTPFFHNLYEFNTGDDDARFRIGNYNVPFSLIFAPICWIGGRALAWNILGIITLWITYIFTLLLLRNYTKDQLIAYSMAALSIALPYRYTMLLGGSPTGLAMAWVPMLLWGLDSAARKYDIIAGFYAALAILLSYWNDSHILLFGVMMTPAWVLFVMISNDQFKWKKFICWRKLITALLPVIFAVGAVVFLSQAQRAEFSGTTLEHGRSIAEVAIFSPLAKGLVFWQQYGKDSHAFIGIIPLILLGVGFFDQILLFISNRKAEWRKLATFALLLIALFFLISLALGTNGPFKGEFYAAARKLIPPYAYMRQPAKIYAMLPPLMAIASTLAFMAIFNFWQHKRRINWLCIPIAAIIILEYGIQVHPTICILEPQQAGYEAVTVDADEEGIIPRALIIPLWPGDSSWGSLYEHYCSLYRIRMINGYRPVIPAEYIENVFNVFGSVNLGELSDEQLNDLQKRGIHYILLHEDAFPEKVSPFPVAFTLKRLLNHPRLTLLKQGENVWAFKIMDHPSPRPTVATNWNLFFPAYAHEIEWQHREGAESNTDETASGNTYISLCTTNQFISGPQFKHRRALNPYLWLRVRGNGIVRVTINFDDGSQTTQPIFIESDTWTWVLLPCGEYADSTKMNPQFTWQKGCVDLDLILYTSGWLPPLNPGQSITLPASLFFHSGYTDLAKQAVIIRKDHQPDIGIFYGPKLPFIQNGEYTAEIVYKTDAPDGTDLGEFFIRIRNDQTPSFQVLAGEKAIGAFTVTADNNLPAKLVYDYSRNADIAIKDIIFTRVK